jgi:NADPH:quinone reductase-like Zn-dependent oxidoreductase
VTGVCSTPNVELVRSLGADHVVDYTRVDFTRAGKRYDLIVDNAASRSLLSMRRALTPTGRLVIVGAPTGNWIAPIARILWAKILSRIGDQTLGAMLTDIQRDDLELMCQLVKAGKVRPVIDRRYRLADVPAAIRYLETMRARGKVIVVV